MSMPLQPFPDHIVEVERKKEIFRQKSSTHSPRSSPSCSVSGKSSPRVSGNSRAKRPPVIARKVYKQFGTAACVALPCQRKVIVHLIEFF
ncbi:hypothetical protein NPIL_244891 [Nephila pilipes]|uniref:Uncharacterized protein n=1 Tax=Nephila pilipes TaxID=299642 RepID=A0A8X6QN16_NEPPI|nr:hypothetical protein NPIL_244891 [Nephila pilipes]